MPARPNIRTSIQEFGKGFLEQRREILYTLRLQLMAEREGYADVVVGHEIRNTQAPRPARRFRGSGVRTRAFRKSGSLTLELLHPDARSTQTEFGAVRQIDRFGQVSGVPPGKV